MFSAELGSGTEILAQILEYYSEVGHCQCIVNCAIVEGGIIHNIYMKGSCSQLCWGFNLSCKPLEQLLLFSCIGNNRYCCNCVAWRFKS